MFGHYFGQFLACIFLGVPVTRFEAKIYKIRIEYAGFSLAQEVGVIAGGTLLNSAAFILMITAAYVVKKATGTWPRRYYQIICYYGIYTVLDPLLILVIDICDYTTFADSDWGKFYTWYKETEGSGIVGIYLTFFLYVSLIVVNSTLFYFYMIWIHQNGRILDLYKRLQGKSTSFFVPGDQEVSKKYLQWVMSRVMKSQKQDFIIRSEDKTVYDKVGR
jgi:hypothetical protein